MFHFRKYIMRNFRFLLLTALFPLIFMGCKSEEDSYPPIHYGYNLAFVDENGNDLIEGMQTGLGRNGKPALREKDYSYKLVEPDSKDDFTGPDCIYVESRDGLFTLAIFDALWEGYKYDKKPEVLRRTFVCPYIFGDGEEHSIISHWKYNDGYGSVELIRVTIDGVDARIELGADKYHPLVVAVLAK